MFSRKAKTNETPFANTDHEDAVAWGPIDLPDSEATNHFLAVGTTGSGKTTVMRLLMQSIAEQQENRDLRAVVYDAKQDGMSLLSAIFKQRQVITLNPFDKRGYAWDIAKDLDEPRLIAQFAVNLFPKDNDSQPFFVDGARHLCYGIMLSYYLSGFDYTFADVLRPMRSLFLMNQIISRHRATRHLAKTYFADKRVASNLLATIQSRVLPFEPVAACWEKAGSRKVSIRDWITDNYILVLGNSEESREAMDSINRSIFKRISEVCLTQSESTTRRTWVFIDELAEAGRLRGLRSLAKKGRSKGVCLFVAFQSISGLRDQQLYGQHGTDELLGQFSHRFIGRVECPETSKWGSDLIGEQEVTKVSTTFSSGQSGSSTSTNYSQHIQKSVLASELMTVSPCNLQNGLTAFYMSPSIGTFRSNIPGTELFHEQLVPPAAEVPEFVPRNPRHQILYPWNKQQRRAFQIKPPEKKSDQHDKTPPPKERDNGPVNPFDPTDLDDLLS